MFFFEPDVVGDILDDFFDHCTMSLCTKITKSGRFGKFGAEVLSGGDRNHARSSEQAIVSLSFY